MRGLKMMFWKLAKDHVAKKYLMWKMSLAVNAAKDLILQSYTGKVYIVTVSNRDGHKILYTS